ncbi:MAG: hypothetical protein V1701_02760 [Planctomycetota bacterium]
MSHASIAMVEIKVRIKLTDGSVYEKEFDDLSEAQEFIEKYQDRCRGCNG